MESVLKDRLELAIVDEGHNSMSLAKAISLQLLTHSVAISLMKEGIDLDKSTYNPSNQLIMVNDSMAESLQTTYLFKARPELPIITYSSEFSPIRKTKKRGQSNKKIKKRKKARNGRK